MIAKKISISLVTIILVGFTFLQAATVWDLANDFSASGSTSTGIGPDAVWSYGTDGNENQGTTNNLSGFSAFNDSTSSPGLWKYSGDTNVPIVFRGTLGDAVDQFIGHESDNNPNPTNRHNIYVWTAPRDMIVNISSSASTPDIDEHRSRTHNVQLRHFANNGTTLLSTLFSENVGGAFGNSSFATRFTFDQQSVSVQAGETISYWHINIGSGAAGVDGFVTAELNISEVVPEPMSLTLVAIASLLTLVFRQNNNKKL